MLPGGSLEDGTADPTVLLPLLRSADELYLVGADLYILNGRLSGDALARDYSIHESNWLDLPSQGELLKHYLADHSLPYHVSPQPFGLGLISHSETLVARRDGVYRVISNERIVENQYLSAYGYLLPAGWLYDDRGIILQPGYRYLIDLSGSFSLELGRVDQPVLLLKIPPEYWP
ncbi:MAG: hypothetical protein ABI847_16010 [Anaerolineales bacterium]